MGNRESLPSNRPSKGENNSDDDELDEKAYEDKMKALKQEMEKLERKKKLQVKRKELQEEKGDVESQQGPGNNITSTAEQTIDVDTGQENNTGITSIAEQTMNASDVDTEHDNADEPELTEQMVGKYKEELKKNGMAGLTDAIKRDIMNWKSIPLNIGIIGESGSGKSSFINAIRDLDLVDSSAAEVGIKETTLKVTPYPHPKRKNLVFWDVPGVGSKEFPRKTYLKAIDFEKYDFYILVWSARFKNSSKWLLSNIQNSGKAFYFIRTKFDEDIVTLERQKKNVNEEIPKFREYCKNILQAEGVKNPLVYLVDNYNPTQFDFSDLVNKLIEDAPALKKEAFVLSMSVMSNSVLKEKRKVLTSRIYKVALLSALGGAIPIPGPDIAIDVLLLIKQTKFYKKQFGTDEKTLREIATKMGTSYDAFVSEYNIQSSVIIKSVAAFIRFATSLGMAIGLSGLSKFVLPLVGSLIAAPAAYGFSVFMQRKLLKMCFEEAEIVIAAHTQWISDNK